MPNFGLNALRVLLGERDEDLMIQVRDHGNPRAFASLVKRWQDPIRNLCYRMIGDMHRAQDLSQETFARLFAKRASYQPTARFSTYLWRIALNLCYDELRRVNRWHNLFTPNPPAEEAPEWEEHATPDPSPDLSAAQAEEGDLVRRALFALPETYRSVLILRHYQGLKLTEIAEALEIPLGTVNSRMAEALVRLTRILEPQLGTTARPRVIRRQESLVL